MSFSTFTTFVFVDVLKIEPKIEWMKSLGYGSIDWIIPWIMFSIDWTIFKLGDSWIINI